MRLVLSLLAFAVAVTGVTALRKRVSRAPGTASRPSSSCSSSATTPGTSPAERFKISSRSSRRGTSS